MAERTSPLLSGFRRRDILRGSLGLGLVALLPVPAWAEEPAARHGGNLRMAFASAPDTLDPQATTSIAALQYAVAVYDALTVLDEHNVPQPQLALSWEMQEGGREWVFQLRQGVRFHDGQPFTARDVVATVQRLQDTQLALSAQGVFGPVLKVAAEGDHQVRFTLAQPFAELPVMAAHRWARILPAHNLDKLQTQPVGTGPFVFGDFQPGSSVSLTRNDAYWDLGKPRLDAVTLVTISDAVAQQAALRSGTVDCITQIAPETFLALRGARGIRAYSAPSGSFQQVTLNAAIAPFDNPTLREAFKYLLDREFLVASALLGQGRPGNDLPLPGDTAFAALPQHRQDLAKAKALYEASAVGPLSLDLYTCSERPPMPKVALALAEAAGRIGIRLNVVDVPFSEYLARVVRKQALYTSNWSAGASLYENLYLNYHSRSRLNYSGVETLPGLDGQLDALLAEASPEARQNALTELLPRLQAAGDRVIPYFRNQMGALGARVQGFTPPAYDVVDLANLWLDN